METGIRERDMQSHSIQNWASGKDAGTNNKERIQDYVQETSASRGMFSQQTMDNGAKTDQ